MKCRICGYELDGSTLFCPKCGTKIEAADIAAMHKPAKEEEFVWNTYDFPKPKKMQDIKMEWSGGMNGDASEGFIQSEETKLKAERKRTEYTQFGSSAPYYESSKPAKNQDENPQYSRSYYEPQFTQPAQPQHFENQETRTYMRPAQSMASEPAAWHMPEQKVADNTPLWATQPLWDARNLPKELQEASMQDAQMFTAQGYIKTMPVPQQGQTQAPGNAQANPQPQPQRQPEQFNTFYRKNDEFQKLIEAQAAKAKSLKDTAPVPTVTLSSLNKDSVEALDLGDFERMILAGTTNGAESIDNTMVLSGDHIRSHVPMDTPVMEPQSSEASGDTRIYQAVDPRTASIINSMEAKAEAGTAQTAKPIVNPQPGLATAETSPETEQLFDLLKEIERNDDGKYDAAKVRDTIETRIKEIREKEARDRESKSRAQEMAKARDIYFKAIEDSESNPAPAGEAKEPQADDIKITERRTTTEIKAPVEPPKKGNPAYYDILNDTQEEEPVKHRSHWLGKLLITLVVIVVVFEAAIMCLKYFIPDHEVTKLALFVEQMVIDICKEGYNAAYEFIEGLIAKYL